MLRRSLHLNIDRYSQESSSYILFENKTKTKIKIKQKNKTKQKIHTKGKKSKDTHTQIHQQIQDMWYCLSVWKKKNLLLIGYNMAQSTGKSVFWTSYFFMGCVCLQFFFWSSTHRVCTSSVRTAARTVIYFVNPFESFNWSDSSGHDRTDTSIQR